MAEDLASLSAQLPDNLAQLSQLDELLQADPTNEELLSIQQDLKQVIQMTIDLQKAAGQLPPSEAALIAATPTHSTDAAHSLVSNAAVGSISSAAAASSSVSAAPTPAAAAAASLPIGGVYPPGSRVMAAYAKDGKHYVSRIDRVDEGAEQYTVTYLEYGQTASVGFDDVRPWVHATPEQLRQLNTPVKALFPEDGVFYNASIDGPSSMPGYYVVKFGHLGTKKKKKVEVPLTDIIINERFMNPLSLQLTNAASAGSKAAAAPLTEELPVPDHLVVHPTDSESVKQQKVRKLKKLRFDHRKAWEAQESTKRASSWQDFKSGKTLGPASKKAKLSHGGGLHQLKKTSIFATPDSIEGVVGVVGSGRGMTEHAAVKKHIFAQEEGKQQ